MKALIERNYNRARQILTDNMDILHAMKDALMKYETIDAPQIDDLMARREVRPPAGWEDPNGTNNSDSNGTPQAPRPVDEPRTPNPATRCQSSWATNKRLLYNIMFSAHRNHGLARGFSF